MVFTEIIQVQDALSKQKAILVKFLINSNIHSVSHSGLWCSDAIVYICRQLNTNFYNLQLSGPSGKI